MLNIIIYEDKLHYMNEDIGLINNVLVRYDIDYRIHKFSGFNKKFKEVIKTSGIFKIYILSIQLNGFEVASYIRQNEIDSIIIFTGNSNLKIKNIFNNRLLVFDYLLRDDNYLIRLSDDIKIIIKMYYKKKYLCFKYNKLMYHIAYMNINYIEKEPLIKRCIIHTIDNNYYIVNSVEKLLKMLGVNFVKTHKSCIVNIDNIEEIDCLKNVIKFKNNDETHLLTDKAKKVLKEYVGKYFV